MKQIKTILVTGGAGFIGSHTVLELLNAGFNVIVIDNLANSVPNGSAASLRRVELLTGKMILFKNIDICRHDQLVGLFKKHKIDGVIHIAALKSVAESCKNPIHYYRNNLIGSINILKVCKEMNVKNFIFSSSCTVYGMPKELPLTEDHETGLGITNPYGQTKYMFEKILQDLSAADQDWKIIILRYFNTVGAHQSGQIGEHPKGIPENLMPYVSQVAVGKFPYLNVYGTNFDTPDGSCVRDFIHVVDLAKGHIAAMKKMTSMNFGYKCYNLGRGKGYSVLEIVSAFERSTGCKIEKKIRFPRAGDIATCYCSPKLAAEDLKWNTEYGIEDICQDLWRWQSLNPNGYCC